MTWSIGISTGACTDLPITSVVEALRDSGARGLELGTPPRHFSPWEPTQVTALATSLTRSALHAVSIHAPFGGLLDLADPNPQHRHATVGAILVAARALKSLGGHVVVVHPSDRLREPADIEARLHDCVQSLVPLTAACEREGLVLALESPLPHLVGGRPDEFAWILQHAPPRLRVCLDTGHVALAGWWRRFMDVSAGRLVHVHANDNHGRFDDHLPLGEGTIDWAAIAASLTEADFDGWVMLELRRPDGDIGPYFRRAHAHALALLGRGVQPGTDVAAPA